MSHTPRKPEPLIQGEWRAHTRRHRRTTGIGDEWYWVARCRTGGMDRQVSLGWHITTRSARESLLKRVRLESSNRKLTPSGNCQYHYLRVTWEETS